MSVEKHHNWDYDGGSPNIPKSAGDRYYNQDLLRDFWYKMDQIGQVLRELGGTVPFLLSGGVVTKGTGDTLNITAGKGVAKYTVTIPNDSTTIPPTDTTVDLEGILVEWTGQTDMSIPSAVLDGATTNYVKIAYSETDSSSRVRAKKTGSYPVEKIPSFTISVDDDAPTDYEVCIAQFTGSAGGGFSISVYASLRSVRSYYDLINTDIVNFKNTTDSSSKDTGAIITEGGLGVAKKAFFGDKVTIDDNKDFEIGGTGNHKHDGVPVAGYLDDGTPFYKYVEAITWNMDSVDSITRTFASLPMGPDDILFSSFTVRNDAGSLRSAIAGDANATPDLYIAWSATQLHVFRLTTGYYDNTNYSSTGIVRGFLVIDYIIP